MGKKVVIIGSGLGGLSCGVLLQRAGFDVLVLEQGAQIGGCLQCFVRSGAKFETGMHFIGSAAPVQPMGRMLEYLGVADAIELSALDSSAYNVISLGGERFCFANGSEAFVEQMGSYFPKEKDGLAEYLRIVGEISASSALNSLESEGRDRVLDSRYQQCPVNEILDELFQDELLKNVLVGDLPLYAGERDKTPFAQHAFIMDFYNRSAFRIVGGSDAIARALRDVIERSGGGVLTRKRVLGIDCKGDAVRGVEAEDGDYFAADYVVSTIHPKRLLELVEGTLLRPAYRKRIGRLCETPGAFVVYLKFKEGRLPYMRSNYFGYRGRSPWGCEHYTWEEGEWPMGFLYMHLCHERHPQFARCGEVISYMNYADVAQWEHTAPGRRGEDYEVFKRQHAERLLALLEEHHPGVLDAIESYWTSTPLTYANYTGTEWGSMYGVAKDVSLGAAGRVPYRTKIPNLYLAGQNVNSHGMMGVLVGSIVTCSEIIRKNHG